MIDPDILDRYSIPLEQQMMKLGQVGIPFQNAITEAERNGVTQEFINDALRLKDELTGKPGDGALEVYRDLETNISYTKDFIDKWIAQNRPEYERVIAEASRTYAELGYLQQLVNQTPPEVMQQIKSNVKMLRALTGRCFIATAVYGDINSSEVQVLRDFRDNVLMETGLGRKAVDLYYGGFGERTANFVRNHLPSTIPFIRKGLDYIVHKYQVKK